VNPARPFDLTFEAVENPIIPSARDARLGRRGNNDRTTPGY